MMLGRGSVLGLIPARGGSKGLPRKNILMVGGQPLIQRTIDAARASRYIDRLVLSSDDPEIMHVARQCGCDVPFKREAHLATDEISSVDVVVDALNRLPGYDIVVLLQPTSPLRTAADIDGTLELLNRSGAPACVTVRPVQDHPYWTFQMAEKGKLRPYVEAATGMPRRRQDLPAAWCLNGAVYAARVRWFLTERKFVGAETVGFEMPLERSLDIDTSADLERLKAVLEAGPGSQR